MIRFNKKIRICLKRQTLKSIPSFKRINIYWHYQSVLYTQFGFHINHFRNLLLTYFIFLSFCCVLIFKWYPFGKPIFSVDQSEWICISFATLTESYILRMKKPVFSFTPSICLMWIAIQRIAIFEAPMVFLRTIFFALFVLFLWTTFSVMIFIIIDSICKCFNYVDSFLEWFWLGSLMYHKSFCF